MPRLCERCQYFTHSNDELTCPECRIPLRFTLMAPREEPVGKDESTATAVAAPIRTAMPARQTLTRSVVSVLFVLDDLIAWCVARWKPLLVIFGGFAGMALIGYVCWSGTPLEQRYARLEVGMDEETVIDILESGSPLSTLTASFVELPGYADDRYTWVWEEGRTRIVLEIVEARVVKKSVEGLPEK